MYHALAECYQVLGEIERIKGTQARCQVISGCGRVGPGVTNVVVAIGRSLHTGNIMKRVRIRRAGSTVGDSVAARIKEAQQKSVGLERCLIRQGYPCPPYWGSSRCH